MKCDVCDQDVAPRDDATHMEAIVRGWPWAILFNHPRHIRCSPSRAQHIVHPDFEPIVDNRQSFDKRVLSHSKQLFWDRKWTAAWASLQEGKWED